MSLEQIDKSYLEALESIKQKIKSAQIKAALAVNAEMLYLYWDIGNTILKRQKSEGWGAKVIDRLSQDLRKAFPDLKGFSSRNLKYMRKFADVYKDIEIVQQAAAQIPWAHNMIVLDKINVSSERLWYIKKTAENGWSRNVLAHQIESGLYKRQALTTKTNNFKKTLPSSQSDLAHEIMKDPYKFDFLTIGEEVKELELEKELTKHITKFLLELGAGFSFMGRQYHLEISEKDYYLDLLFYHVKLKCYVVVELKIDDFKPEYAGKMNFYLSAVDDLLKAENDNPSIGLILCKTKDHLSAEYALRNINKPMGISEYKLSKAMPKELKANLPSIEEIEKELAGSFPSSLPFTLGAKSNKK